MSSGDTNILTARQLIRRHRDPAQAFKSYATTGTTLVDIKSARNILQGLTGVTLTPVEMLTLSKKYGDGKTLDYQRFLQDQHMDTKEQRVQGFNETPAMPSARMSTSSRATTPNRERAEPPLGKRELAEPLLGRSVPTYLSSPGIDKEGGMHAIEHAQDSRLLMFGSDSMTVVPLMGRSPAPVVSSKSNMSSMRPTVQYNMEQRGREYSVDKAAVVGSELPELHRRQASRLDEQRNFSSLDGAGTSSKLLDPLYHTGHITGSGGLASYVNDLDSGSAPGPEYLPVFPGDDFAKLKPRDNKVFHSGPVSNLGGVSSFVSDESWHTDVPPGYLAPLPNSHDPEMPIQAVSDRFHTHGEMLEVGGVGPWNNDIAGYLGTIDALHQLHADPLYHSGIIKTAGGLGGYAAESTSWLQRVPLTAKQSVISPYQFRRAVSAGRERSERGAGTARRQSVPNLVVATPTKAGIYGTDKSSPSQPLYFDDEQAIGSPNLAEFLSGRGDIDLSSADFAMTGKPVGGITRVPDLQLSTLGSATPGFGADKTGALERTRHVAGPITDVYGLHHKALSYAFGARSPIAVALAASPMVKFDGQRLAAVRKSMREKLPEKSIAAATVLRARLSKLDGDGDGRVTESELLGGLAGVFPDLDAAAVGMLVRYFRHKAAAEHRATASARSAVPVLGTDDSGILPRTRDLPTMVAEGPSGADEVRASAVSTAGFGEGIDVKSITEWVLKQPGGVAEVLSPLARGGIGANITAIPGWGTPPKSPPGPQDPGSAKPVSHLVHAPKGTLVSTDSAAMAAVLSDRTTATQHGSFMEEDLRAAGQAPVAHTAVVNEDSATMFTDYLLPSGTAAAKAKSASYGEMYRRKVVHAHAAEYRRGDSGAPAAGVSLTGKRLKDVGGEDEEGGPMDRTEWATRNAKFESFRVKWEASHGAPARKEMMIDAQIAPEGPTWTRAQPAPFKVLHIVKGPLS